MIARVLFVVAAVYLGSAIAIMLAITLYVGLADLLVNVGIRLGG